MVTMIAYKSVKYIPLVLGILDGRMNAWTRSTLHPPHSYKQPKKTTTTTNKYLKTYTKP